MARKKRIWYPGAIYHVMSRGNRRTAIFEDEADYICFLELLKTVKERYPFILHSICLMTNHFHMLIETGNYELGKIMQVLLSSYAEKFNYRHSYSGHLFEGRYTACIVEDERYLLEVSRYIHLNPVKAFMVRDPISYKYSSYRNYVSAEAETGKGKWENLLRELTDTTRILSFFPDSPQEQYRKFVEGRISHEEQELQIRKDMKEDDMWLP